jgi:ketosteroid isomerase-like protein
MILATLLLASSIAPAGAEAPADPPLPSVTLPPELSRVLTDYEAAWRSKDAVALALLFAEDGFVLQRNKPPVRGRAGIQKAYEGAGGPLVLRALAWATEGPVGYIIGAYSARAGEPDDGKFTLTLKKGPDGKWRIMSDMDNGNRPPR